MQIPEVDWVSLGFRRLVVPLSSKGGCIFRLTQVRGISLQRAKILWIRKLIGFSI